MTEQVFELSASKFADLIKPVLPFAEQSGHLPLLNAVRIESRDDYLTATTTDRFRIGVSRVRLTEGFPVGLDILVGLDTLRHIMAIFKRTKTGDPMLKMTVTADDRLRVEQSGGFNFIDASMTFKLLVGEFPKIAKLLTAEHLSEPAPVMGVNAAYLADFKLAARGHTLVLHHSNALKPMIITAGDHFIGAIMPVRAESDNSSVESWSEFLAEKPARKTRAKSKAAA